VKPKYYSTTQVVGKFASKNGGFCRRFQKVGSRGPKNDPPLETAVLKMIMALPAFVFGAMSTRTFKKSLFSSSRCRLSPAETPLSQTSDSILLFQLASSLRPPVACSIACLRTNRLPLSWASTEAAFSFASLDLSPHMMSGSTTIIPFIRLVITLSCTSMHTNWMA